jgi:hypothetical protein
VSVLDVEGGAGGGVAARECRARRRRRDPPSRRRRRPGRPPAPGEPARAWPWCAIGALAVHLAGRRGGRRPAPGRRAAPRRHPRSIGHLRDRGHRRHVDHGKSTLSGCSPRTEPDRWAEERRRD